MDRLFDLAEAEKALDPSARTILQGNNTWHFPFPAANTTPWQLEGTIQSLQARGLEEQVFVQNNAYTRGGFKGENFKGSLPILKRYGIHHLLDDSKSEVMRWSAYRPSVKMNVLDSICPEGILIPDDFHGANIVHLPTVKCDVSTTTSGAGGRTSR